MVLKLTCYLFLNFEGITPNQNQKSFIVVAHYRISKNRSKETKT